MNCRFSLKTILTIIVSVIFSSIITYYATRFTTAEKGALLKTTNAISEIRNADPHFLSTAVEEKVPSKESEMTRRRILAEATDTWYFIAAELTRFTNTTNDTNVMRRSKRILEESEQRHLSIVRHLRNLSAMDGLGEWRAQEARNLTDIVQGRLQRLQNPADCATAQKAVCDFTSATCGTTCQFHHLLYCMVIAYATQRTLVFANDSWMGYEKGWQGLFRPLSDTCVDSNGSSRAQWPNQGNSQTLYVPHRLDVDVPNMPPAIPEDLSDRLIRLHGHPGVWWMGQLFKYLLRPNEDLEMIFNERASAMDFENPIVGIHVRRSDKLQEKEASYHSLEDYMMYVEHHFKLLELETPGIERRVYIATDDPSLYEEAKTKYPHYTFLGDKKIASSAEKTSTRYSDLSLQGLVTDIHFLSRSDFIVCTFSSSVCKLAYALMQTYRPDASADAQSLDDIFYYVHQPEHLQRALETHIPRDASEIDLQVGDLIHVRGNFWNGSTDGINKRSGKGGLYPSYKVEDVINVAKMASYP